MDAWAMQLVLLAEEGHFESVGRHARKPASLSSEQGLLLAVVFVLAVAGVAAWSSYLERRARSRRNSPWRLFWELCQAHCLPWRDRWTLWQVSRHQRLADPARVFLEPQRLEPANLSPALRRRSAQVASLRARLFAGVSECGDSSPLS